MSRPGANARARLSEVLARERRCLIDGDYAPLADLAAQKANLISVIEADMGTAAEVTSLLERLRRNHDLTRAACDGMEEARQTITEARARATRLRTYGPNGVRSLDCAPGQGPPKRA